ncbi:MAG: YIP1 family protein [Ignavibacteriales bacterium]|nr:YIP1 family protein [Ignavibacteriales bacterium]
MIACSVCQTQNDTFAVICSNCKAFLQNRIPNLDLFQTSWRVIESPRQAFHDITLADHKNYSLILYGIFGIALTSLVLSFAHLGDSFSSLLGVIVFLLATGFAAGLCLAPFLNTVHWGLAKIVGGKGGWRISLGLTAYSLVPMTLSVVLLLPIELLTFGMYIFTGNPPPYAIKPALYIVLIGLEGLLAAWSFLLLVKATAIGYQLETARSTLIAVLLILVGGGTFWIGTKFLIQAHDKGIV